MSESTPVIPDEPEPLQPTQVNDTSPEVEGSDDDLAALLRQREHARPNRVTWVLITVLVLMIGFVGGAWASQKFATSSGSSSRSGFPAGFPAGLAVGGFPGAGATGAAARGGLGGFGNATFGTVKLVDGTNLYITTAAGETVKVKVPGTAKVTSQKEVALAAIPTGSTVVIQGDKGNDGTVTATSVSEGALPGGASGGTDSQTPPSTSTTPTQGAN